MASPITTHRPALAWLQDLQKAKIEGITGAKPKATIQDLLERINDPNAPEQALIPSSPRSVEACFQLGIDPVDLQYHPIEWYQRKEDADGDVSKLRYERNEAVRQERLRALMDHRKKLIDEGWSPTADVLTIRPGTSVSGQQRRDASSKAAATSSMVDKERQRLEVLRRRQERDLAQMVQHEQARKELLEKQQQKVQALEKRAAELARLRVEHEQARMNKQREIELQKAAEEREHERRARILAEERYQHEKKIQAEKAEAERQLKKKAFQEEVDRRRKAEEARKETEAILAAQAEEVRLRKIEMEKRDAERIKRMAVEAKQRQLANLEKRKLADARIAAALGQSLELMARKRAAYEQREAEAAARRQQMEKQHAAEEARKREDEARKQQERHDKYLAALAAEEARKAAIKARADEKDAMLAALYSQRKKNHDLKKVDLEFQLKLRLDKVDSIQKTQLYQRQLLLGKIMSEYDKTRTLMREREELQEQRKMSNVAASMQRAAIAKVMDTLRTSKNVSNMSINELINQTRPATAL